MPLVFILFPYVKMEHFNWDVKINVMFMVLCVRMGELECNVPLNFYVISKNHIIMPLKLFCVKSSVDKSFWFVSILLHPKWLAGLIFWSSSFFCLKGVFIICWLPFFLTHVLKAHCRSCCISPSLYSAVTWLGYLNSAVNPVIYTTFNIEFRKAFIKILHCWLMGEERELSTKTACVEEQGRVVIMREPFEYYLLKNDRKKWIWEPTHVTEMIVGMRESPRKCLWQV